MSDFSDILVRVGADVDPLKKGFNQAGSSVNKFKSEAKAAAAQMAKVGAAAAAAGLAIGAGLVARSMKAVDAQAKLATQLQTTSTSIANLELAADLSGISMQQLSGAAKAMNVRLAEAAGGTGEAVSALGKMGVTTKQLEGMTLDKKIAFLNDAIKNNVDVSERAAVAADLYGARAGAAIATMDSEVIAKASADIERFGLAISDVDAAKIEAANDAMTLAKKSTTGFAQSIAVQLAPVIGGLADRFTEVRGETSMLQDVSEKTFGFMLKAVGFVSDAIRGIQVITKGIELAFWGMSSVILEINEQIARSIDDFLIKPITASINALIDGFNKIPGIDINNMVVGDSALTTKLTEMSDEVTAKMKETAGELHDLLMKPLPSTEWEKFVANAQKAGEEAAQAVVTARQEALTVADLPDPKDDPLVTYADKTQDELTAIYARGSRDRVAISEDETAQTVEAQKAFGDQSVGAYSHMFGNISSLMESENRKQFEIGKKAAAGQAIIDTIASAQAAFKSLAGIPIVGPGLGIAAAGAATLAGMMRLQQINSTSFGSKSAPSAGGSSTSTSAAASGQAGVGGGGGGQSLVLEGLDPQQLYTGDQLRGLIDAINEQGSDGQAVVMA